MTSLGALNFGDFAESKKRPQKGRGQKRPGRGQERPRRGQEKARRGQEKARRGTKRPGLQNLAKNYSKRNVL